MPNQVFIFQFLILFSCRSEIPNTEDTSVDGEIVVSPSVQPEPDLPEDIDEDGFPVEEDCDDWNPTINPDADEIWDGKDNNCDGWIDIDGIHRGDLSLQATAIYEGNPYNFSQSCSGVVRRELTQASLEITCLIDQSQENANLLLGETIVIKADKMGLYGISWNDSAEIASSGGEMEWDSTGQVELSWSLLEEDGGNRVQIDFYLDSLSLAVYCDGEFLRVTE